MNEPALLHREEYHGIAISFRRADRYVDATELCRAAGRRWNDYYADNVPTAEFLRGLSNNTGTPVLRSPAGPGLIELARGRGVHTWVHPRVAWHLAYWASPEELAVWVTDVLDRLSQGLLPSAEQQGRAVETFATKQDIAEVKADLRLVVDNTRECRSAIDALGFRIADATEPIGRDLNGLREDHAITQTIVANESEDNRVRHRITMGALSQITEQTRRRRRPWRPDDLGWQPDLFTRYRGCSDCGAHGDCWAACPCSKCVDPDAYAQFKRSPKYLEWLERQVLKPGERCDCPSCR